MADPMWDPIRSMAQSDRQRTLADGAGSHMLLEAKVEYLSMICRGLFALMEEKLGLSEAELIAKVREIDLLDGKLDNRLAVPPFPCPGCERLTSPRVKSCMYCGQAFPDRNPFDRV